MESGKSKPKAKFSVKLPNGDFLQVAVWAVKADPLSEVISVQIQHRSNYEWSTVGKLAIYRGKDGSYAQLRDRPVPASTTNTGTNTVTDDKTATKQDDSVAILDSSSFKPYDSLNDS